MYPSLLLSPCWQWRHRRQSPSPSPSANATSHQGGCSGGAGAGAGAGAVLAAAAAAPSSGAFSSTDTLVSCLGWEAALALGILSLVLARRMQALTAQAKRYSSKLAEMRVGGRLGEGGGGAGGRGRGKGGALVSRGAEAEAGRA